MISNFKKKLDQLLEECREESYQYFDKNIRPLPKNESGEFIITRKYFYDNDVDAFRHAYTSGVFTQEFFSAFANVLGVLNEMMGNNTLQAQNMDLWNNFIGRKNGKKTESRTVLAEFLKKALENGEMIISPDDPREYKGLRHFDIDPEKPVRTLEESKTGLNEHFFDVVNYKLMTRQAFIDEIFSGNYPGYQVVKRGDLEYPMSRADAFASNNLG
jgi:hypothetical protein